MGIEEGLHHIRRIYKEANANCRHCFLGETAAHMLLLRLCSRRLVKRRAGSKFGGNIAYFIIDRLVFHQMFCGTLANKTILKIIKSVFTLEIQIYKKTPAPPPPTKAKGKVQRCVHITQ